MKKTIGICAVALVAWLSSVEAKPVPALDLVGMINAADVIVLATIERIDDGGNALAAAPNGPTAVPVLLVEMSVAQVLKGSAPSNIRARFVAADSAEASVASPPRTLRIGAYRMAFLVETGGQLEFVSAYYPTIVGTAEAIDQTLPISDRVLTAVAGVVGSDAVESTEKYEAIHTLWGIEAPSALAGVRRGLDDADRSVRLTAAAALLSSNDLSGWPAAEAILQNAPSGIEEELVHNLRVGISQGVREPAAIPGLSRLLTQSDPATRRAAIAALAGIDSRAAIRPLMRALDDTDFEVRLSAVRGLADRAGQPSLKPSEERFRLNEPSFTLPLREWGQANVVPE